MPFSLRRHSDFLGCEHERPVFPPLGNPEYYALAAIFVLRARAARKSNSTMGSQPPFAALAHRKHWVAPPSVRFLQVAQFTLRAQRMSASLIGYLGQALFPCLFWVFVTHPGHASLRSLV